MQGFPMDSHVTWTTDPETGAHMPVFDRAVTSEPLREYIKGVITNGVLPNPSTNLQVSAGTNGMTVVVRAGFCVIEGGLAIEPNTRTLEVTAADSTYDRIDTVVARWDANDASRKVDLHIRAGVPASSPVRPTLTREGSIYELGLADVFVTKNVATITNEKITDTRYESARCGICSSIAEWDTTTIYRQVQADLAGFKTNEQAEFLAWFDHMKDQLSEDAAGHLQSEIDEIDERLNSFFDIVHPVGELYITTNASFNPNTATGWKGTWERDKGRFVRLAGDNDEVGSTGGADERTLTADNLPSHYHEMQNHTHYIPALSGSTGTAGNHAHTTSWQGGEDKGQMSLGSGGSGFVLNNPFHSGTNYAGDHSHTVTTKASTTGAPSNNKTTSTGSGTAFDNRPFHENYYGWRRTA